MEKYLPKGSIFQDNLALLRLVIFYRNFVILRAQSHNHPCFSNTSTFQASDFWAFRIYIFEMRFQFVNFYENVVINERNIFFVFAFSCKKLISSKSFIWKGIVFVYSIIKDHISRIKILRNALNFYWNLPMLIHFLSDWILNCCIFPILWQTH